MNNLAVVILAAGKSTRMKTMTSKVLHKVAGLPLVAYPIERALELKPAKTVVVIGKGSEEQFEDALGNRYPVKYCVQQEARGTGDAVLTAEKPLKGFDGYVLIIPGDVPLIFSGVLNDFVKKMEEDGTVCGIISTTLPDPHEYGRVLRDKKGEFIAIREARDATEAEKEIDEINTGIFLVKAGWLFENLKKLRPDNAQGEYYLTDLIEIARAANERVAAHCVGPWEQFTGVNDRFDLSYVGKAMQLCIAEHWMARGVSIEDPDQTYIDSDVKIGEDTNISPFVFLKGKTSIGKGCVIEAGAVITDVIIGEGVHIKPYSVIEKSRIMEGGVIGPFSRVRPDSVLGKNVKIGNFVEIKKSILKTGAKASHLSYIGDATIGEATNVGCGTITCNYDGRLKHRTVIGRDVFIGSDTQFVAPVRVGKGAVIGAGSTITKNVPPGALGLARSEQVNIKNWAAKKAKAAKSKKSK